MEMLDGFIEQQRQIYPFPDEAAQLFLSELEEVSFRKGDWLVREGDHDSYVWFVLNGLVRAFVERKRDTGCYLMVCIGRRIIKLLLPEDCRL